MLLEKEIKSNSLQNMIFEVEQLARTRKTEFEKIGNYIDTIIKAEMDEIDKVFSMYIASSFANLNGVDVFGFMYNSSQPSGISEAVNEIFKVFKLKKKKLDPVRKKMLGIIVERYKKHKLKEIVIQKTIDATNEEWTFRKMKIILAVVKVTKKGGCHLLFARHNRKRWTSIEPTAKMMEFLEKDYISCINDARIELDKEVKYLKRTYKATKTELEPLMFGLKIGEGT